MYRATSAYRRRFCSVRRRVWCRHEDLKTRNSRVVACKDQVHLDCKRVRGCLRVQQLQDQERPMERKSDWREKERQPLRAEVDGIRETERVQGPLNVGQGSAHDETPANVHVGYMGGSYQRPHVRGGHWPVAHQGDYLGC